MIKAKNDQRKNDLLEKKRMIFLNFEYDQIKEIWRTQNTYHIFREYELLGLLQSYFEGAIMNHSSS